MESTLISVELAARLVGKTDRYIRKCIASGDLPAVEAVNEAGGGNAGSVYRVPLDALPYEAQILYWSSLSEESKAGAADLLAYKHKYGDEGLRELLKQQRVVRATIGLRKQCKGRTLQSELERLAAENGTTLRTLYRWEKSYKANGLGGLMRKKRSDAETPRTMCYESRRQTIEEYLTPERRAQDTIFEHLLDRKAMMGESACEHCPYRRGSDNRDAMVGTNELRYYPECKQAGNGIIVPNNRSAINRVIDTLSEEEKTYMRKGRKAWEAAHMLKATREKPNAVNKVWFGDHGQFDLFCIDHDGRCVRPWLTLWFDAGSGMPTGWAISSNPNSRTITQAFVRGAAAKLNSQIRGVPEKVYVDNGKDYRCEALEGGTIRMKELGQIDRDIGANPLYEALNIQVMHAKAYHGWVKPIERFFRTLWEKFCREQPGYCGGSADKRPENFDRTLQKLYLSGQLLTIDELADKWLNEIIPAYANRPHSGYGGRKPIDLYNTLPRARDYVPGWSTLALAMNEMTERKVSTQGIRFANQLYWSPKLMHMSRESVIIRYDRDDLSSITVCTLKGNYICMAEPKESMKMVDEDPEKVAIHVAMQKVQERELRERLRTKGAKVPGKRASGHVYFEEVDESYEGNGNIASIAAELAARDRKELAKTKEQRRKEESGEDRTAAMFRRMFETIAR
ncbi:MAG: transposase family protein [Eubacteriales bacterium]|nr:transposase family protein [Eubacteriales bacterium]